MTKVKIGISRLSICPIRAKPDDRAEMVSQLLFGERVHVLDQKNNWIKVKCTYDGYEGWMDSKQITEISIDNPESSAVALEISEAIFCDGDSTYITLGAELPLYDGMTAEINEQKYRYSGQAVNPTEYNASYLMIEKLAKKLMNTPYLWGGRSPFGIDCSGFTQLIFKCIGVKLSRDSIDQAKQGETVDFVELAAPGDLAFFTKKSSKISHVGILLDDGKIVHASGRVRIDSYDHYGIFNQELEEYTHRLKIIKRFIKN